jgi:Kef-type K+ transport system membrane component KefB
VLKDAGAGDSSIGRLTVAAATLADVAAVLLLTLLFSEGTASVGARVVLLLTFVGVVVLTAVGVLVTGRWRRISEVVLRLQDTSAEIRVARRSCCCWASSCSPSGSGWRRSSARCWPGP